MVAVVIQTNDKISENIQTKEQRIQGKFLKLWTKLKCKVKFKILKVILKSMSTFRENENE